MSIWKSLLYSWRSIWKTETTGELNNFVYQLYKDSKLTSLKHFRRLSTIKIEQLSLSNFFLWNRFRPIPSRSSNHPQRSIFHQILPPNFRSKFSLHHLQTSSKSRKNACLCEWAHLLLLNLVFRHANKRWKPKKKNIFHQKSLMQQSAPHTLAFEDFLCAWWKPQSRHVLAKVVPKSSGKLKCSCFYGLWGISRNPNLV